MKIDAKPPSWQKGYLIALIVIGVLVSVSPVLESPSNQADNVQFITEDVFEKLPIAEQNSLLPITGTEPVNKKIKVVITAYSSTFWQTDNTPLVTAAGTSVRDGIIANNLLPFGTRVRIPELYGNKVFIVEDRMHYKKGYYHVDIWFASYEEAVNFGAKNTYIEILES